MKYLAIMVLVFGFTSPALAAVGDHPVTDSYGNVVSYIPAGVWEKAMSEQRANASDSKLPKVSRGVKVTDEAGYSEDCPVSYSMGCVDLTKTPEYRASMIALAKDMIAKGIENQFPVFAGWVRLAR